MTMTRRRALGSILGAAGGIMYAMNDVVAAQSTAGVASESLDAIAQRKGMRFGSAIGDTRPDSDQAFGFQDERYRALVARECGVMVTENEMKWQALRPSPREFDFAPADKLVAWAKQNRLLIRGHTLLWHEPKWQPEWLNRYDFGARPVQEAERLLGEHIATVCRRYAKDVHSWDVLNESVAHEDGELRTNAFTPHLGNVGQIDFAFRVARENAPQAQLVYNDYMNPGNFSAKHRAGVLKLLHDLKARGTPVDALGLQSHIGTGEDGKGVQRGGADERDWRSFLDEVTAMGLDLLITELDVNDRYLPAAIDKRDAEVAAIARAYLDVTLSYPRLRTVVAWGLPDHLSWLQPRWPRPDGLPKRPCPYDAQLRPKALRATLAAAFQAMPARKPA